MRNYKIIIPLLACSLFSAPVFAEGGDLARYKEPVRVATKQFKQSLDTIVNSRVDQKTQDKEGIKKVSSFVAPETPAQVNFGKLQDGFYSQLSNGLNAVIANAGGVSFHEAVGTAAGEQEALDGLWANVLGGLDKFSDKSGKENEAVKGYFGAFSAGYTRELSESSKAGLALSFLKLNAKRDVAKNDGHYFVGSAYSLNKINELIVNAAGFVGFGSTELDAKTSKDIGQDAKSDRLAFGGNAKIGYELQQDVHYITPFVKFWFLADQPRGKKGAAGKYQNLATDFAVQYVYDAGKVEPSVTVGYSVDLIDKSEDKDGKKLANISPKGKVFGAFGLAARNDNFDVHAKVSLAGAKKYFGAAGTIGIQGNF